MASIEEGKALCRSFGEYETYDKGELLLAESTCAAPCWNNLEPGVSTREDARAYFQTLSLIDYIDLSSRTSITWETEETYGNMYFDNNQVIENIEIYVYTAPALQNLIEAYGEPTHFRTYVPPLTGISPYFECENAQFIWPQIGLSAGSHGFVKDEGFGLDLAIRTIQISRAENDIVKFMSFRIYNPEYLADLFVPWTGTPNIENPEPGETPSQ